ncbi:hypothetical protein TC41_1296 [Alicyclobacillus acidocaldarius subsp. acidocaldarius Tc-4-1]|uniref:Uncharacterized protein n=1 Tax=Alicyclobacillus acidocaldarius (strain Tc-4-1) TaxID=1048834 RepID=F8IHU5_ALIAT|nr:hypothetical protein TC41_1296 [Alicyclobacillus acidocaldarius subsp. acidocaldarius Tc-4-1]
MGHPRAHANGRSKLDFENASSGASGRPIFMVMSYEDEWSRRLKKAWRSTVS